jgi:DNA polymerase-1
MKTLPTLIIDADVPLYRAAIASEVETDWGNDDWTLHSDMSVAREIFEHEIEKIRSVFHEECPILLCFSTPENWRKSILPTYKANRKKNRKPIVLKPLRAWAEKTYDSLSHGDLEADDLLGLLKHKGIMVSVDKDLKTVPGVHYNPDKWEDGVYDVTKDQAHYHHMYQTLCGDSTDGYKGCPAVGPKTAEKILDVPVDEMWTAVLETFASKKLTYEDALVQARVARILRASDYDFSTSTITMWEPSVAKVEQVEGDI